MPFVEPSDPTGNPRDRRKLVAMLYADMVGYSRLIGLDDAGTLNRLRGLRQTLIDPAIEEHGGRIVQTGGDSLLVVFDSVDGAIRCAVKVQQGIPTLDADQPPDRAIRFRIGINLGDAIPDGTDLHGDAVNIAARLQAECPPGGICVSRSVRDHVHGRLGLAFEELGPLHLKNIARPVEAFVLSPPFYAGQRPPPGLPMPSINMEEFPRLSVVVLRFRAIGSKSDDVDLAEALTNDLTTELARIPGALVIAPASAMPHKDGAIDYRHIGEELGVRYAIEGTIRTLGDTLRISVRLVATATSKQIWADRFDMTSEGLAVGHDAVMRRISTVIDSRMLDAEIMNSFRERPHNPNALDLLFRAWSLFKRSDEQRYVVEASQLLEQALQLAPSMVLVLLSLADRLIHRFVTPDTSDWGNPDLIDQAHRLLSRAEQSEPNDEWLMFYRGSLLRARGHWSEASLILRRLIAQHPNNHAAHRILARCSMIMGWPGDAIELLRKCLLLDPVPPLNRISYATIGNCLLLQGKASEAIEWLQRGLSETSENERGSQDQQNLHLASAYALIGDIDSAARILREANRSWPFATIRSLCPFYEPRGLPGLMYVGQFRRIFEGLRLAGLREYADEASDFGVSPRQSLWPDPIGRTPLSCPGTVTIQTEELVALLEERSPVLIDVALGSWGKSLPGAIGLQGAGYGSEFSQTVQDRFRRKIIELTNGDRAAPIVAFCVNSERLTAYNLALRLVWLGCTSVYWYRGGVEAWQAHDLPGHDLTLQEW
jgi:adenylate cyclase